MKFRDTLLRSIASVCEQSALAIDILMSPHAWYGATSLHWLRSSCGCITHHLMWCKRGTEGNVHIMRPRSCHLCPHGFSGMASYGIISVPFCRDKTKSGSDIIMDSMFSPGMSRLASSTAALKLAIDSTLGFSCTSATVDSPLYDRID